MRKKTFSVSVLFSSFLVFFVSGCALKYPKCEKDEDCREGEFCIQGLCQQCGVDADCDTGQRCVDGACEVIPGYCADGSECPQMNICENHVCREVQCMKDEDCGPGEVCRENECTPAAEPEALGAVTGEGGCTLDPVYFEFDSSLLDSRARRILRQDAECLETISGTVVIEGHCDPRGTSEYNMALGERRARAVRRYLKNLGVQSGLRVISKGEEEATGYNKETWQKDRRAEFQ